MKMEEHLIQPNDYKYRPHKVVIDNTTYLTKLDKTTNKPVYKKRFSISTQKKLPLRTITRSWQTSVRRCNQEVQAMRVEYRLGKPKKIKGKHLFKDIVDEYYKKNIQLCIDQNKSFGTMEKFISNNYKYVLNEKMIYPNFINKYIENITINDIKELKHNIITYALKNDLSKLTVGFIFTNIDKVFKYCAESMFIDDTIPNNIRISPQGVKAMKKTTIQNYLLKNEFDELMKVFDTDFTFLDNELPSHTEYRKQLYKIFLECAFKLGFRKSEGFALTWGDYQGDKITIRSTLNTRGVKKHLKTKAIRVVKPKTAFSDREMHTPKSIRKYLDEWKCYCNSIGVDTSNDAFVFKEIDGLPFKATTFTRRFQKVIDVSQIEKKYGKHLYPHGFRHSCCSFLIEMLRNKDKEISIREIELAVGNYLGHSNGKMVREVYGHLYPDKEKSLMTQVLDEI